MKFVRIVARDCPACGKRKFKKNLMNGNMECSNCGYLNKQTELERGKNENIN